MYSEISFRKLFGYSGIPLYHFRSAYAIREALEQIKPRFNKSTSIYSRIRILDSILPSIIWLHRKYEPDNTQLYLFGGYFQVGMWKEIGLTLHYSQPDPQPVMNEEQWEQFCLSFIQAFSHELIHGSQMHRAKRHFGPRGSGYFEDPNEIDAYAHCAYLDSSLKTGHFYDQSDHSPGIWYENNAERRRFISKFHKWQNRYRNLSQPK